MTKKEILQANDALSVLIGTPLRDFGRIGGILYFNFGDMVELKGVAMRDENNVVLRNEAGEAIFEKFLSGMYELTTMCGMRFICGNDVIFASGDIFIPSEELYNKVGFTWDNFDWHTHGSTLFDELLEKHFRKKFDDYIVKSLKAGRFGDLTITFENDFVLEFFSDTFGGGESWRFGETASCESLIVTTKGIATE